ncbi:hypothetical protein AHF37_10998 [Paragonimus kellicotti]|nr:hypothetical protein AHF37_10998 [Paragonimus kellicotti]
MSSTLLPFRSTLVRLEEIRVPWTGRPNDHRSATLPGDHLTQVVTKENFPEPLPLTAPGVLHRHTICIPAYLARLATSADSHSALIKFCDAPCLIQCDSEPFLSSVLAKRILSDSDSAAISGRQTPCAELEVNIPAMTVSADSQPTASPSWPSAGAIAQSTLLNTPNVAGTLSPAAVTDPALLLEGLPGANGPLVLLHIWSGSPEAIRRAALLELAHVRILVFRYHVMRKLSNGEPGELDLADSTDAPTENGDAPVMHCKPISIPVQASSDDPTSGDRAGGMMIGYSAQFRIQPQLVGLAIGFRGATIQEARALPGVRAVDLLPDGIVHVEAEVSLNFDSLRLLKFSRSAPVKVSLSELQLAPSAFEPCKDDVFGHTEVGNSDTTATVSSEATHHFQPREFADIWLSTEATAREITATPENTDTATHATFHGAWWPGRVLTVQGGFAHVEMRKLSNGEPGELDLADSTDAPTENGDAPVMHCKPISIPVQASSDDPTSGDRAGGMMIGYSAQFRIQPQLVGLAIGFRGATIQEARALPGVRAVDLLPDGIVHVEAETVEACQSVRNLLDFTEAEIPVSPRLASRLIGSKGMNIRKLAASAGVRRALLLDPLARKRRQEQQQLNQRQTSITLSDREHSETTNDTGKSSQNANDDKAVDSEHDMDSSDVGNDGSSVAKNEKLPPPAFYLLGTRSAVAKMRLLLEFQADNWNELDELEETRRSLFSQLRQSTQSSGSGMETLPRGPPSGFRGRGRLMSAQGGSVEGGSEHESSNQRPNMRPPYNPRGRGGTGQNGGRSNNFNRQPSGTSNGAADSADNAHDENGSGQAEQSSGQNHPQANGWRPGSSRGRGRFRPRNQPIPAS